MSPSVSSVHSNSGFRRGTSDQEYPGPTVPASVNSSTLTFGGGNSNVYRRTSSLDAAIAGLSPALSSGMLPPPLFTRGTSDAELAAIFNNARELNLEALLDDDDFGSHFS
jgi:hypothetical protein